MINSKEKKFKTIYVFFQEKNNHDTFQCLRIQPMNLDHWEFFNIKKLIRRDLKHFKMLIFRKVNFLEFILDITRYIFISSFWKITKNLYITR